MYLIYVSIYKILVHIYIIYNIIIIYNYIKCLYFFPEFPGCTTMSTTFTIRTETLLLWQLKTPVFLNCCLYKPLHL